MLTLCKFLIKTPEHLHNGKSCRCYWIRKSITWWGYSSHNSYSTLRVLLAGISPKQPEILPSASALWDVMLAIIDTFIPWSRKYSACSKYLHQELYFSIFLSDTFCVCVAQIFISVQWGAVQTLTPAYPSSANSRVRNSSNVQMKSEGQLNVQVKQNVLKQYEV